MRAMLGDVGRRGALVTKIDDGHTYDVAAVTAPVFRGDGRVELAVAASAPPAGGRGRSLSGADLRALGDQVVTAARELTAAVHGRQPDGTGAVTGAPLA